MIKKVLIVEDTTIKYNHIRRALQEICNDLDITRVKSLNPAKECLTATLYDLIVTDMRYPEQDYGQEMLDAGFQLVKFVQEQKLDIPIIIYSTSRFKENDVLGTVHYSERTDLYAEFKQILDVLQ